MTDNTLNSEKFKWSLALALDYIKRHPDRYLFPIKAGAKFPQKPGETRDALLARLQPLFFDPSVDPSVTNKTPGAGRDPAVFPDPDRFDVRRDNARQNLAFARGPHFCLGVHLARLEARAALTAALSWLPGLRLDPDQAVAPRGLVFRKPPSLPVRWDAAGQASPASSRSFPAG